jgi:alkanesulfonate monooxygenase SsuD/methylene tetrahydromethanopterin reductase-like flavin-dependent oxidoreductase (luciferase family)
MTWTRRRVPGSSAAVAVATSRIGMIATASTTYTEPFNLARQFGSLDHISNGRVGWNIVTSWLATAARNFGGTGQVSHADRYALGEEFMTVVKALWDSWADDAVIDDRNSEALAAPSARAMQKLFAAIEAEEAHAPRRRRISRTPSRLRSEI